MCLSTNRQDEPEVYFRVVHAAQVGHNGGPVATYREQMGEIALGLKGAFENGKIGALTRRVPADRVVNAIPPLGVSPKPPRNRRRRLHSSLNHLVGPFEHLGRNRHADLPGRLEIDRQSMAREHLHG